MECYPSLLGIPSFLAIIYDPFQERQADAGEVGLT